MNEISLAVSPVAVGVITFVTIAVIKLVDDAFAKDWKTAVKIIGAALVGALVGHFTTGVGGFNGMLVGLSASGLITTAAILGTIKTDSTTPTVG